MKKQWRAWIGVIISAVALAWVVWDMDFPQVIAVLSQGEYLYLLPAAAAIVAYMMARSIRWRLLLGARVGLARSFWITNVGYLVSNVLPFRLGDPARAVLVGVGGEVPTTAALSTVAVERVLDMLMVVSLLAAVAPFVGGSKDIWLTGAVAGGAALLLWLGMVLLAVRPEWGKWLARRLLGRIPRLDVARWARPLDGLIDGLAPLRSARRSVALLLWSVVTWACAVAFYWALLRAFLRHPPLLAAPFLVCAIGLGMSVPSSPGAIGVFQAIVSYTLPAYFSIPHAQADTIAFAMHAFQYLLGCLLGLIGLWRIGYSMRWVRDSIAEVAGAK